MDPNRPRGDGPARAAAVRLVELSERWDAAEPRAGRGEQARRWRAVLEVEGAG